MSIADFIAIEAQKPFAWGETDCVSTVDRWIQLTAGRSPLAWVNRAYASEGEANSILADRGGLAVLVNRAMRAMDFDKTSEPRPGDVGLIIHNDRLCMAIHAGACWFSHDEHGLIGAPVASVWKAWRIECQ